MPDYQLTLVEYQRRNVMSRKTKARITELTKNFPILEHIQLDWRWREQKRWRKPKTRIHVQLADSEAMHLQARNCSYHGRAYLMGKDDERGAKFEYLIAVDWDDREIAKLLWERGELEKMSKDIFKIVQPEKVSHLVFVSAVEWYRPPTKEQEAEDISFGTEKTGVELEVIIYRKPKGKTFQELIETADREKKERDEAYKHFPKEMPELIGIHKALLEGCRMHAFLSGGGLRVIRLEIGEVLKGYGEHPHVEEALRHSDEDFLAGKRERKNVYGKLYPHYLTGATLPTSNLDAWIRRGNTFDSWQEGDEIVFQLKGYAHTEAPEEVNKKLESLENGESVLWKKRGFTYSSAKGVSLEGRGSPFVGTTVVDSPIGKNIGSPWMYSVSKTGRGRNFWDAVRNAFAAEEIEVKE